MPEIMQISKQLARQHCFLIKKKPFESRNAVRSE